MNRREFGRRIALAGASGLMTFRSNVTKASGDRADDLAYTSRADMDESPLEFARVLGDKFINSQPQVYYPTTKEAKFYPWLYPTGVALWALCRLSDLSGNPKYLDFVRDSFDYYIANDKVVCRTMNHGGCMGHALLELNVRRPERRYREVISMITDYYEHIHPRLLDGSLCYYKEPQRRRTWIDALFIVCPVLAKSAGLLDEPQHYDDVFRQFFNYTVRLQDPEIKLFYQGWGWGTNRTTHSPGFWSRGNGWVLMAMTEVLKTVPENHPQWRKLLGVCQEFAAAVLKAQGETGLWHQLMTRHDSFQETSGTAMFVYSFIHGHRHGWLSDKYRDSAQSAFEGLRRMVDLEGNIHNTCIGTGTQNTLDDYYQRETPLNDSHGIGPVILAACAAGSVD